MSALKSPSHRVRLAGVAALATATATISMFGSTPTAHADPAPAPEATVLGVGAFDVTPAPGSCAAVVTLEGGNGGTAVSGGDDDPETPDDDPLQVGGGQGARIQFRIPVSPTDVLTGVVGAGGSGGGLGGASGDDKGGNGGPGGHSGGGGGGYTSFILNGTTIALAGGGGGSGGGHNPDAGGGGHAGVVEGTGIWAGQEGANGNDATAQAGAPGGGAAGGTNAPGAGGVHATDTANNGLAGDGRNGGTGGGPNGADQGGGGGAGYFGGGGGATTIGDVSGPNGLIIGGGGGGGSSFLANAQNVTYINLPEGQGLNDNTPSRNGAAELAWEPCNYDLGITKTAAAEVFESGTPVSYTIKVTNHGPDLMGIDDTVTVTDLKAAGGTLVSVVASGSGTPFTCDTAIGATIPADGIIDCSRPVGDDVRGLDNNETLTLVYSQVLSGNAPVLNTVSVTDRANPANNSAAATVAPAAPRVKLVKKGTPKRVARLGQKIKYTFKVTNTGNIALKTIAISEQKFTGKGHLVPKCPSLPSTGLAPGASVTCKATYKVHKRDLVLGKVVNVAKATATTPAGNPVESLPSKAKVKTPKLKEPRKHLPGTPNTGARAQSGR
ncbi:hypothetical protein GUY44_29230 [Pimelobacter simplex]|uniref:DUF7507 domain-containing protein n=1 Tax=Nocardioides simplex TaxID=2045 RepID=UPI0008E41B84|nr:DUF11 domain-containing protein [Pimelobacter simplex]MCG8154588.1 hypothetical protein [Pimelobacter simplex]SFM93713.1 conserved repeat domain-containing protein [Pimelobacter simplex]